MSNKLRAVLLLCFAGLAFGMGGPGTSSYRFPMEGSEFILSGTFGELRTNHFHSGIDIKTGGETGKRIVAARNGYIYRIKVSPWGFGKAIYLRHPDGEFTVYAHLRGFNNQIEEYVYQKQYASKSYEQEIYLPEDEIPVQQGQLIGYSGNSGSSGGPHLHFEIRDPDERITNVVRHFKHAIRDDVRPILQTIGIQPLDANSRANGRFEKLEMTPDGSNGNYNIPGVVRVDGKIGLEYHGYDLLSAAPNHCGINYVKLYLDDQLIYNFNLDTFSFDEKKYINVHFDYPHYKQTGRKFQRAYRTPGNLLTCYAHLQQEGIIELRDREVHQVRLEMMDTHRNVSTLRMKMKQSFTGGLPETLSFPGGLTTLSGEARQNFFICRVTNPSTGHLRGIDLHYTNGSVERLKPAYLESNQLVFLTALDKWRLPKEIKDPITGKAIGFNLVETILPDKNNIVELGEVQLYFPYAAVFDSLPLHIRRSRGEAGMASDIYEIGRKSNPLFKSFVLNFRPNGKVNESHAVVAKKSRSGRWSFLGKELNEDGSIYASSGYFGTFCVMTDSISPTISAKGFSNGSTIPAGQSSLRLKIQDNFAGIDSGRILGTIDDRWVLFEYDAKTNTITHKLRERPRAGGHTLRMMVYDNANNLAEKAFTLYF